MITKQEFMDALARRHGAESQERICRACVGIAGLGGLGSHIAFFLARAGVGRLILVDFDTVDLSNLNRQQYRLCDIGTPKPQALAKQLQEINPFCRYDVHFQQVTPDNLADLFGECDVLCEAFDAPEQKAMLIENALQLFPQMPVVAASGMAGFASANRIQTARRMKNLYLCGDGETDIDQGTSLVEPRVAVCAGHQALMALRLILGNQDP